MSLPPLSTLYDVFDAVKPCLQPADAAKLSQLSRAPCTDLGTLLTQAIEACSDLMLKKMAGFKNMCERLLALAASHPQTVKLLWPRLVRQYLSADMKSGFHHTVTLLQTEYMRLRLSYCLLTPPSIADIHFYNNKPADVSLDVGQEATAEGRRAAVKEDEAVAARLAEACTPAAARSLSPARQVELAVARFNECAVCSAVLDYGAGSVLLDCGKGPAGPFHALCRVCRRNEEGAAVVCPVCKRAPAPAVFSSVAEFAAAVAASAR